MSRSMAFLALTFSPDSFKAVPRGREIVPGSNSLWDSWELESVKGRKQKGEIQEQPKGIWDCKKLERKLRKPGKINI